MHTTLSGDYIRFLLAAENSFLCPLAVLLDHSTLLLNLVDDEQRLVCSSHEQGPRPPRLTNIQPPNSTTPPLHLRCWETSTTSSSSSNNPSNNPSRQVSRASQCFNSNQCSSSSSNSPVWVNRMGLCHPHHPSMGKTNSYQAFCIFYNQSGDATNEIGTSGRSKGQS